MAAGSIFMPALDRRQQSTDNLEQRKDPDEAEIWCVDDTESPQRLSVRSRLLVEAKDALTFSERRWFLPREIRIEAREIIGRMSGEGGAGHG